MQTVDGTAVSGVVGSEPTEALEGFSYATTLFERFGVEAAIEGKYMDALTIFHGEEGGERTIISVYEKRSYEEAMEDLGWGAGFLFSIERLSHATMNFTTRAALRPMCSSTAAMARWSPPSGRSCNRLVRRS